MNTMILTQLSKEEFRALLQEALSYALAQCPERSRASEDDLLTTRQASALLHLSPSTLYGLVHHRRIPCMKQGKRLYFSKKALLSWLSSGSQPTQEALAAEASAYLRHRTPHIND